MFNRRQFLRTTAATVATVAGLTSVGLSAEPASSVDIQIRLDPSQYDKYACITPWIGKSLDTEQKQTLVSDYVTSLLKLNNSSELSCFVIFGSIDYSEEPSKKRNPMLMMRTNKYWTGVTILFNLHGKKSFVDQATTSIKAATLEKNGYVMESCDSCVRFL